MKRPSRAGGRVAAALAAPAPEAGWGMPRDVSEHGVLIDRLIHTTTWFIVALFSIMVVWMLWACFRHGRKHEAQYDHGTGKRAPIMALGIAAFVFFVVDGNLFVNSTLGMGNVMWNFAAAEAAPDAVRIELNAHCWAWDARYAGPDGKFGTADDIVTLNDIRVPKGSPVIFQIAATDVIHSFYVPNLRIKTDAVPGTINWAWFRATATGEFEIACAQHCGTNHYKMRGVLTVLERPAFDRWAAETSANAVKAFDPKDAGAHWGWEWRPVK